MNQTLKTFAKFVVYSVLADLGLAAHFGVDSFEKLWPLLVTQIAAGALKAAATYVTLKMGTAN